jgi:hypothetical protein
MDHDDWGVFQLSLFTLAFGGLQVWWIRSVFKKRDLARPLSEGEFPRPWSGSGQQNIGRRSSAMVAPLLRCCLPDPAVNHLCPDPGQQFLEHQVDNDHHDQRNQGAISDWSRIQYKAW